MPALTLQTTASTLALRGLVALRSPGLVAQPALLFVPRERRAVFMLIVEAVTGNRPAFGGKSRPVE